jgi:hypothetical protein
MTSTSDETTDMSMWLLSYRTTRCFSRRLRPYALRVSKLERYHKELVGLLKEGASLREIRSWLLEQRRQTRSRHSPIASISTIHAYLRRLQETA